MTTPEHRIKNRTAYFRKAIITPNFESERVIVHDPFEYADLWLSKNCKKALPYWKQAKVYFQAGENLPPESAPLTLYYGFLNAVKALLIVKGVSAGNSHGVAGKFISSKTSLKSETIRFKSGGVIAALSRYLKEKETNNVHSLKDILSNLPFIHRAFRNTYTSHPDLFLPLRGLVYRKDTANYVSMSANLEGRFADNRTLQRTLPPDLEFKILQSIDNKKMAVIRSKKKIKWPNNPTNDEYQRALTRLQNLHFRCRNNLTYISASPHLWYVKRKVSGSVDIRRHNLTLIISAMHRFSELSRYEPDGLMCHLRSQSAWLITEFIRLAPNQFIDELVCEMTNLEIALPGIRPRNT